MLTKLLKYEFRATARLFLPLYVVLLVFALINRFINFEKLVAIDAQVFGFGVLELFGFLARLLYFVLVVGILVMTLLILLQRFYKSLLGDEGYLMFTLPVRPWQHIVSKLIAAAVWVTASGLVTAGSIMILTARADMGKVLQEIVSAFGNAFGVAGFFVFPGALLAVMASGILMIYAATALGHISPRHKILASLAWYAALGFASTTLLSIFLTRIRAPLQEITGVVNDGMSINLGMVWYVLLPAVVLGVIYFVLTDYILERRLNLE